MLGRYALLSVACIALLATGCDTVSPDEEPSIEGLWELQSNEEEVYWSIGQTSITTYAFVDGDAACYAGNTLSIVRSDGERYVLREDDTEIEFLLEVEGNTLTVTFEQSSDGSTYSFSGTFHRSDESVNNFSPRCNF